MNIPTWIDENGVKRCSHYGRENEPERISMIGFGPRNGALLLARETTIMVIVPRAKGLVWTAIPFGKMLDHA